MNQYAVVGNPITHSKSPQIHREFAKQCQQDIEYSAMHSEVDAFEDDVKSFFLSKGLGLNITVPFKLRAHDFADQLSERAKLAGAVNTLIKKDNLIIGDNTDGLGLVRDITHNQKVTIKNQRLLIIGAGGATQGVIVPLLEQSPKSIHIVNRTDSKAQALAEQFSHLGDIQALSFDELSEQEPYAVIINASSAGLNGEAPALPKDMQLRQSFCYDMVYAKQETPFVAYVKSLGSEKYCDGLGMLVEQAAESFMLWRNVRPETQSVLQRLRSELA